MCVWPRAPVLPPLPPTADFLRRLSSLVRTPLASFFASPSYRTLDRPYGKEHYDMDELTELRQQVSALQLQNTQLMVRLVSLSLLLVCGTLGWVAFHSYTAAPLFSTVPEFAQYEYLTFNQQGLLRDQAPCPQSPAQDVSGDAASTQGPFNVGVMVLGASGTC